MGRDEKVSMFNALKSALMIVAVALALAVDSQAALEPSSKRECAICHVMWMEEFKGNEETLIPWVGTNVLMKKSYGVVSSEEMCYSCHDGFVVDSRRVWTGKRHTVFKKPSAGMKIDEQRFPLSVKGEVYCGTCHSIHSEDSEDRISYKVFLRMGNRNSEFCIACHKGYDPGPKKGSHSVSKEIKGGFPEDLSYLGLRPDERQKKVICNSCHLVHGADKENLIPTKTTITDFCGECHKDENVRRTGEGKLLAHKMGVEPKNAKPSELLKKSGARFEEERLGCLSCHKTHKGKGDELLVMENRNSDLCLQCHDNLKGIKDTPHNMSVTGKDLKSPSEKKTIAELGVCGTCHNSHGWAQVVAEGSIAAAEVCNVCHAKDRKVTKIETKGPYNHSIDKTLEKVKKQTKSQLPLFNTILAKGDRVYCATCHDPHLSKDKGRDDRGLIKTKFLRDKDKTALCVQCHSNEQYVKGTDHDSSLFEKKYVNTRGELPSVSGLCGTCHLVHEGPKPIGFAAALPTGKYPEEVSRDMANLHCLACHEEGKVGDKKLTGTISHPIGRKPKEAEGKLKDEYVTCKSCHSAHLWSPLKADFGPGKNIDGDLSTSFLRRENRKAGLCKECHKTPSRVIESRHDVSEKENKGICEFCHSVHNAKEKNLWTRKLDGFYLDEKTKTRMCLECHRKDAPGEKSIVKLYRHPMKLLLINPIMLKQEVEKHEIKKKDPKEIDVKGAEIEMGCVVCHDPHVWAKKDVLKETAAQLSSLTAFLRLGDPAKTFCTDCHRIESRYKYQYYHKEKARIENNPYYEPERVIEEYKKIKRGGRKDK